MIVRELINELKQCNPDASIECEYTVQGETYDDTYTSFKTIYYVSPTNPEDRKVTKTITLE